MGELFVEQPNFQHIADARLDLDQIERLADEVAHARLQRAQLMARLRSQHEDRKVGIGITGLERFNDLEPAHLRHLQIEQNQIVGMLSMQGAYFARIGR